MKETNRSICNDGLPLIRSLSLGENLLKLLLPF
jgi:hypothetical protein